MKKVRLFAVAAAMGMFASTVAAAEPTVKDSYVATWGAVDEIIKVDVGDKVVAPTAEIKVVKESRTTDKELASKEDSLGIVESTICYEGFTNVEGTDDNADGYADKEMLTAGIYNLTNQGWLHTDAKFFPSVKTSLYYVGLGGGQVTGGRFLAPGAAKNEKYTLALSHKDLADDAAVLAYFEEEGVIKFNYDKDGYIDTVEMNPVEITDEDGNVKGTVFTEVKTAGHRYSDDEIKEAVVKALLEGNSALAIKGTYYTTSYKYVANYTAKTPVPYAYYDEDGNRFAVNAGEILVVKEDKYGNFNPVEVLATSSDLAGHRMANGDLLSFVEGKIVIALDNEEKLYHDDGTEWEATSYSKYMTITPQEAAKWTPVSEYAWDAEGATFNKNAMKPASYVNGLSGFWWNNEYNKDSNSSESLFEIGTKSVKPNAVLAREAAAIPAHTLGLYHVETPANTSEKIVIFTDGLDLTISGINTKKETMTLGYTDAKGNAHELTTAAVKLDGKWYPAVDTEAELAKVIEKVLNLRTLEGTTANNKPADPTHADNQEEFDSWAKRFAAAVKNPLSGVSAPTRTNAEGEKEEYMPENAFQHYKGTFCTYKVAEGEDVSSQVTFESNADAVDTSVAGVKDLTLTAKIGSEVVDTKTIKVVVAPKYERTYKNGRVATLKAFHLNGNLYAVYNYDWAAKTYTATFYAQDGVTVASTANGPL